MNAAATFNRDLINQRGVALGAEFQGKGVNIMLGMFDCFISDDALNVTESTRP